MISIDDFKKVEMKIGKVLSAEKVENADKLLKLSVDFGLKPSADGLPDHSQEANDLERERDIRQVVSGIALFVSPEDIVGKKFPFVTNLEPRMIRGLESQAMILALGDGETFSLLVPTADPAPGSPLR